MTHASLAELTKLAGLPPSAADSVEIIGTEPGFPDPLPTCRAGRRGDGGNGSGRGRVVGAEDRQAAAGAGEHARGRCGIAQLALSQDRRQEAGGRSREDHRLLRAARRPLDVSALQLLQPARPQPRDRRRAPATRRRRDGCREVGRAGARECASSRAAAAAASCAARRNGARCRRCRRCRACRCSRSSRSARRRRDRCPRVTGRCRACACSISRACWRDRPARARSPSTAPTCCGVTREDLADMGAIGLRYRHRQAQTHIDLRNPAEAETMRSLVRECDVFSQSYRPGALARPRTVAGGDRGAAPRHRLCHPERLGARRPVARPPRLRHGRAVGQRHGVAARTTSARRSCRIRRRITSRATCSLSARWLRLPGACAKAGAGSCGYRSRARDTGSGSTACSSPPQYAHLPAELPADELQPLLMEHESPIRPHHASRAGGADVRDAGALGAAVGAARLPFSRLARTRLKFRIDARSRNWINEEWNCR